MRDLLLTIFIESPQFRLVNYALAFTSGALLLSLLDAFTPLCVSVLIVATLLLASFDEFMIWSLKQIKAQKTIVEHNAELLKSSEESSEESESESDEQDNEQTNDLHKSTIITNDELEEDDALPQPVRRFGVPACAGSYSQSIGVKTTDEHIITMEEASRIAFD